MRQTLTSGILLQRVTIAWLWLGTWKWNFKIVFSNLQRYTCIMSFFLLRVNCFFWRGNNGWRDTLLYYSDFRNWRGTSRNALDTVAKVICRSEGWISKNIEETGLRMFLFLCGFEWDHAWCLKKSWNPSLPGHVNVAFKDSWITFETRLGAMCDCAVNIL